MCTITAPLIAILLVVGILFFASCLLFVIAKKISAFTRELDYLNMEIGRTSGKERQYWERKKRRLWLSLLPFVHE